MTAAFSFIALWRSLRDPIASRVHVDAPMTYHSCVADAFHPVRNELDQSGRNREVEDAVMAGLERAPDERSSSCDRCP
jgi:hypothetical protein